MTAARKMPAADAEPMDHSDEWEAEVDRRIAEVEAGAVEGIPMEEAFARIDAKLAARGARSARAR